MTERFADCKRIAPLLLTFLISACGAGSGGGEAPPVQPAAASAGDQGAGEARALKAEPALPAPAVPLLPEPAPREVRQVSEGSISASNRIIARRRARSDSSPTDGFQALDVRRWSIEAGIFHRAVVCPPGLPACTPMAEQLNIDVVSLQEDTGVAVVVIAPAVEAAASAVLAAMRADPALEWAAPDVQVMPFLRPNEPEFVNLWGLQDPVSGSTPTGAGAGSAGFESAWDTARPQKVRNAIVAVIDTGYVSHPDFAGNAILPGVDFISDPVVAKDGDGRDNDPTDPGDSGTCGGRFDTSSWHGTHLTGTIAATANNAYGVVGAGYDVLQVVPVRVLGLCGGLGSDVADAIVWAAGGRVASTGNVLQTNPNPVDVINLSLGGTGACPAFYQTAIDFAVGRGVIVVVAAGNSAADTANATPANCRGVIAVGAHDKTGRRASFSNLGAEVAVLAPGVAIKSTVDAGLTTSVGPTLAEYSGTSMAAPHVAAAMGLLKAVNPGVTPADAAALLRATAAPFADSETGCTSTTCGAGYLQADTLIKTATGTPPSQRAPIEVPEPALVALTAPEVSEDAPATNPPAVEPPAAAPPTADSPPANAAPAAGGAGSVDPLETAALALLLLFTVLARGQIRRQEQAPALHAPALRFDSRRTRV